MDKQNVAYPYKEYYLAIKKNEVLIHTTTWMNTEIMLSEARHKRSQIVWLHFYEMLRVGKSIETKSILMATWAWRWVGGTKFLFGWLNVLKLDSDDHTTLGTMLKNIILWTLKGWTSWFKWYLKRVVFKKKKSRKDPGKKYTKKSTSC